MFSGNILSELSQSRAQAGLSLSFVLFSKTSKQNVSGFPFAPTLCVLDPRDEKFYLSSHFSNGTGAAQIEFIG